MKNKLPARQIAILVGDDEWLQQQIAPLIQQQTPLWLKPDNFAQAKNLLGQEFPFILYDARQGLNLDALAIGAGTLQAGGLLLLCFAHWQYLANQTDLDSLRWAGTQQAICTPHFVAFLQQKVQQHQIALYQQGQALPAFHIQLFSSQIQSVSATAEQQQIIQQILAKGSALYLITAKRGRGKSALVGLLVNQLREISPQQRIILTAPNQRAVKILRVFLQQDVEFIAPDALCQQLAQAPEQFAQSWLLIDEGAALPLEYLNQFTYAFQYVVCTTTTQSYEGTGRGFVLKFIANLTRSFQHFTLHQPLRWAEDDPIEPFIEDLLLLNTVEQLNRCDLTHSKQTRLVEFEQLPSDLLAPLYGLLSLAHYRTSPLDLRRLLDAPMQRFFLRQQGEKLLAVAWLLEEGGMTDFALMKAICRGERRPPGNLVAQSLAMQGISPLPCQLRSLRISRIAVQPDCQGQGIGTALIKAVIHQADVDFLSVSFGYTPQLAHFWQQCGFQLVYLGEHKEASSACYSAIMLYPISQAGEDLVKQLGGDFQRNLALSFHPLREQFPYMPDWVMHEQDWQSLKNFIFFARSLWLSLPAIRRFLAQYPLADCPLLRGYCASPNSDKSLWGGKKNWLRQCRLELQSEWEKYYDQHKNSENRLV